MASSASSTFNTTTAPSTSQADLRGVPVGRPYYPAPSGATTENVGSASVATAPTGAPPKQAASVAIQLPPKPNFFGGQGCQTYFDGLSSADKKTVCDALADTDTQLDALVEAINGYVQALVGREAALRKQLDQLNEKADAEEADTGSVSADTQADIQATEAALDTTATELAELRNKVKGYEKLPGVIGAYNKYFEALRTAIQKKTSIPVASGRPSGLPPGASAAAMDVEVPAPVQPQQSIPLTQTAPPPITTDSPEGERARGMEVQDAYFGPEPGSRLDQSIIEATARAGRERVVNSKRAPILVPPQ
jgi:hypothetical protein